MPLEVAVFSFEDAILASTSQADRLEICIDYAAGGLTMPLSSLSQIRHYWIEHRISKPIYAMIRPVGGTFTYGASTFDIMKNEIRERVGLCDGFVFGITRRAGDGEGDVVDEEHCSELVQLAGGLPCTFHRAIDGVRDPVDGMRAIKRCGFANVLSSGRGVTAAEGAEVLRNMVGGTEGVSVVAGGGVRSGSVMEVLGAGAEWLHTAAMIGGRLSVDEIGRIKAKMKGHEAH